MRQHWYDDTCEYTEKYKSKKNEHHKRKEKKKQKSKNMIIKVEFSPYLHIKREE